MNRGELNQLYEEEPGLWEYFVAGAPAQLLVNYSLPRRLANGTPVIYHSFGYYDRATHAAALAKISAAGVGEDVVLDQIPDFLFIEVPTDEGGWDQVVLPYHRAGMSPTKYARSSPMRGKTAVRHDILDVDVYKHAADRAFVATDYKFQGRGEDYIILSLMNAGCSPSLLVQGMYVFLTRSKRGREGMRLLLPPGHRPEDALKYLLTMERPKDLVLYLRGFDEEGFWCPERSKAALVVMNQVEAEKAAVAALARRTSRQAAAAAVKAARKAAAATVAATRKAVRQAAVVNAAALLSASRQAAATTAAFARSASHQVGLDTDICPSEKLAK